MMKNSNTNKVNEDVFILPTDLLDETLKAIEDYEEIIDGEWGKNRTVKQLLEDGCMPYLYYKLLSIKEVQG